MILFYVNCFLELPCYDHKVPYKKRPISIFYGSMFREYRPIIIIDLMTFRVVGVASRGDEVESILGPSLCCGIAACETWIRFQLNDLHKL